MTSHVKANDLARGRLLREVEGPSFGSTGISADEEWFPSRNGPPGESLAHHLGRIGHSMAQILIIVAFHLEGIARSITRFISELLSAGAFKARRLARAVIEILALLALVSRFLVDGIAQVLARICFVVALHFGRIVQSAAEALAFGGLAIGFLVEGLASAAAFHAGRTARAVAEFLVLAVLVLSFLVEGIARFLARLFSAAALHAMRIARSMVRICRAFASLVGRTARAITRGVAWLCCGVASLVVGTSRAIAQSVVWLCLAVASLVGWIARTIVRSVAWICSALASFMGWIVHSIVQSVAWICSALASFVGWIVHSIVQSVAWVRAAVASVAGRIARSIVQSLAQVFSFGSVPDPMKPCVRAPVRLGHALILLFMAVFVGWGYFVPLYGGAVASGVVNPDSGKKTIQHLEGGIIADLSVREGEVVKRGQPLVVLESTQARAAHEALVQQHLALVARKARLDAERAEQNRIEWPEELRAADLQTRSIVEAQQEVFEARRSTYATKRNILAQRIEQLLQQIRGAEAQVESASRQLELISEELRAKEYLVKRGLVPKPEALRLKRMDAELSGKRGEYVAEIARAEQQIGEARLQILAVETERNDQIAAEAEKVRAELTQLGEKLQASADVVKRTVVVAPVSGTVVEIKFKTIGGIVQSGEPIMSIVPSGDELIIEARLTPVDVKAVHSGLEAQVHLSAYSSRIVPKIPGTVLMVSADRLMDETTHQPYYLARVVVDRETLHRLAPGVDLIPGMPVEVLVVTERRTMVDYLVKPFRDALWRSFRET